MGSFGFTEMLFIAVLALLIFGPKKLPELARMIGKTMAEFRRASSDLRHQLDEEMRTLENETRSALDGAELDPAAMLPAPSASETAPPSAEPAAPDTSKTDAEPNAHA
jgi:sec-independent protein translocase protein TatB